MSAGRPKKDMSQEAVQRRKTAGERLKQLRQGKIITPIPVAGLTQKKLATFLDRDISVIRGYESGSGIPDEIATKLEALTGIIKEYWLGATEKTTLDEYQEEIAERNRRFFAVDGLESRVSSLDAARKTFFEVCGYSYEHLHTGFVEFARVIMPPSEETEKADPSAGRYYLTSLSYPDIDEVEFTPEEMDALIRQVKDIIAFECSKKQRRG